MRNLTRMITILMLATMVLTGCIAPVANAPVEPEAGQWQTWVVSDVATIRPPAPPDGAVTQTELQQVQQGIAGRTEEALQQIAYWDSGTPSYRWLEILSAQNRATPVPAPSRIRMVALFNVAIYDAMVAAWDAKYTYNRTRPGVLDPTLAVLAQHTNSPSYPSEHAVAAGAAAAMLGYFYPDAAQSFLDKAQAAADSRVLAGAHFPSDVAAGLELGRQVAEQVIAYAQQDDALDPWDGVIPTGDGYWTGENPVLPIAGQWQTWVLASGDELRPDPPLAYDSPELAAEMQEVVNITRTWQLNQRAAWWQLPEGSFESWYLFANLRMFEQGLDANPPRAARIYALMSIANHDAIVACWDAKYTYWSFRPFQMDPTLKTLFPTPSYPSYPSGHACGSTAISEVLADQFPAYAEEIRARAADAYESRIIAGIHFRHEMVAGKEIGLAVAQQVIERGRQMSE